MKDARGLPKEEEAVEACEFSLEQRVQINQCAYKCQLRLGDNVVLTLACEDDTS